MPNAFIFKLRSMNVLEIHSGHSWWFSVTSLEELHALRQKTQSNRQLNDSLLSRKGSLPSAFYIKGDVSTFNLLEGAFDAVVVRFVPSSLQKAALKRRVRKWLAPNGRFTVEPLSAEPIESFSGRELLAA
jgi:hypothetical protein